MNTTLTDAEMALIKYISNMFCYIIMLLHLKLYSLLYIYIYIYKLSNVVSNVIGHIIIHYMDVIVMDYTNLPYFLITF